MMANEDGALEPNEKLVNCPTCSSIDGVDCQMVVAYNSRESKYFGVCECCNHKTIIIKKAFEYALYQEFNDNEPTYGIGRFWLDMGKPKWMEC